MIEEKNKEKKQVIDVAGVFIDVLGCFGLGFVTYGAYDIGGKGVAACVLGEILLAIAKASTFRRSS